MNKGTVFVLNLGYDITADALHNLFGSVGHIEDVRIVLGPNGKPKGFAYVQFNDEKLVPKAISAHNGAIVSIP
jgi:RNA recognition motif-containing protein